MTKFNLLMQKSIREMDHSFLQLNQKLIEIISKGFVEKNGLIFLKYFFDKRNNVTASNFIDSTGYEAFINSIHIDDYVDNDFLLQGFLFFDGIFKKWKQDFIHITLVGIISCDEFRVNTKFFIARKNENYFSDNLEACDQPVLITDSENWKGFLKLKEDIDSKGQKNLRRKKS